MTGEKGVDALQSLPSPDPSGPCGSTEVVPFLLLKDSNPVLREGDTKASPLGGNAKLSPDLLPPPLLIPRPIMTSLLECGGILGDK